MNADHTYDTAYRLIWASRAALDAVTRAIADGPDAEAAARFAAEVALQQATELLELLNS